MSEEPLYLGETFIITNTAAMYAYAPPPRLHLSKTYRGTSLMRNRDPP
jgi:hypothetical protein